MRHEAIQKDRMRFRRNMQRIGEIFAYEISKTIDLYKPVDIQSPLGTTTINLMAEQPVICSILRAGIPLHEGLLNYFDKADNGFISAYRKHDEIGNFEIRMEYISCPDIENRILILCDPMLATGSSMEIAYKTLLEQGRPQHTHIVSIVSTHEGIEHLEKHIPQRDYTLWVGAIDDELTAQSYIVPGLGDAGDLAFGEKIQN